MAVDIEYRLSGGSSNADPTLSIGGVMSSVEVTGSTLFDTVGSAEALTGDTEYRKIFITNNGTTIALSTKVFIQANTPSADTTIAIALDGGGVNNDGDTAADEGTAPSGESFTSPTDYAGGLSLGDLAEDDRYAVWIRRTVSAAAAGSAGDTFTIRVGYDYVP